MHTTDLYTADFPHGTPAGYEQGCRGGACPNRGSAEEQTCKDAQTRYQRDPDYKRLVKSGAPLEQLAAKEDGIAWVPATPKPAPPRPRSHQLQDVRSSDSPPTFAELMAKGAKTVAAALLEVEPTPPSPPIDEVKPNRGPLPLDHPDFPHGTTRGANRGCKDAMDCPGDPVTGVTCVEARRQYNRDYAKNHTKTSPGEGSAPTPNVPAEQNQARETGGTTPAESEATIRTPEPSTVDHTPPTPDEPIPAPSSVAELTAARTGSSWSRAKDNTIIQAYVENAAHDAEHIKQLTITLEETRDELREAHGDTARASHDYTQLFLAHEQLRNDRTIDTQLAKLVPALAGELEPTGGEAAAQTDLPGAEMLLQPEAAGGIRVALRGNTQPMRFHVSFEDGQASTVSVSLGGE